MHSFHSFPPHPRPPRPAPSQGYLLRKIIACEKRSIPNFCAELHLDGCDTCTVQSVCACAAPVWSPESNCTLRISVPLSVRLCDACGHSFIRPASIDVETQLPHHFLSGLDDPRNTLLILPCVRLVHAGCLCGSLLRVQLHVSLEIFLLRWETCRCGAPRPECPQLPLYPPPMC